MRSDGMIWVSLVMVIVVCYMLYVLFNGMMMEVEKVSKVFEVSLNKGLIGR